MEFGKFKINATHPTKTKVEIDGEEAKGLYGYNLRQTVEELPELILDFHVFNIAQFEGEGIIKYDFSLPDDKRARKALYEQLKTEFEE